MKHIVYGLIVSFLFICHTASSQAVHGYVANTGNQPLPFVSVMLFRDSLFIAGTVTGEDGRYQLTASFENGAAYRLRLSLAGYEQLEKSFVFPDTTSLGNLQLQKHHELLGEVVVNSKKPLVTRQADRYIVNVENSYLANGQTGLDVLQRSPGLWVNPLGEIRIIGGQTVTVMINDVVQRMSSADLANFLRALRSEDISRIEVIPNPPAEFEAASSGGIIHIILKKARRDGLTGNAGLTFRKQGIRGFSSAGTSIDYKIRKLYFTTAINAAIDRSVYTGYTDVTYPDKSGVYNYTFRDNDIRRYLFRAGMVYDVNPRHSIFLQATHTGSKMIQFFESDLTYSLPSTIVTGQARSDWLRKPKQGSYTLNYGWKTDTLGSSLKLILDHTYSLKSELNELHSRYSDPLRDQSRRTNTPSDTYINSGQVDYTQVLTNRSVFKGGIKYVHTGRDNTIFAERIRDNGWEKDEAGSDDFRYTEQLLMFYGAYEKTFGKTSIKTGLRGEQTVSEGLSKVIGESIARRYFGLFPSLFISHTFNEDKGRALNVNYSRRVRRPGYNDLNPYRLQVHDFTLLTGNPDLVPQYSHSLRATFNVSHNFSAGTYLQRIKNYIAQTAKTIDSNIIEYKSKNFPSSTEYGVFLEGSFNVGKTWNSRSSAFFYSVSNDIEGKEYSRQSFSVQSIQVVNLKNIMDVDFVCQYTSAVLQANSRQASIFSADIGLTRKILKDKGRLRFSVNDIFNGFTEKTLTEFNQTRIDFYQKRPTRTFGLSFNYSFTAGKAFTKKRLDNNDTEEKSRL